jgi:hypothetical protein
MSSATFTDNTDRRWTPALSFATVIRIRKSTGIDFGKFEKLGESLAELMVDDEKTLDAVWLSIEHEGTERDVTKDDWLAAMDGPRLEAARESLHQVLRTHVGPKRAKMIDQALAKLDAGYSKAVADAIEHIQSVQFTP